MDVEARCSTKPSGAELLVKAIRVPCVYVPYMIIYGPYTIIDGPYVIIYGPSDMDHI